MRFVLLLRVFCVYDTMDRLLTCKNQKNNREETVKQLPRSFFVFSSRSFRTCAYDLHSFDINNKLKY